MPFILLVSLILIHELGHFLCAFIFKIEVDKIYIYPLGGISKFNILLNEKLWKEFLILIMGPLFQIIYCTILCNIDFLKHYHSLITSYNQTILYFNMLPIYPLDGGKLLNLLLSIKLSFKKSLNISLVISCITVGYLFSYIMLTDVKLNYIVIIIFLIIKIKIEIKNKNYLFDKFLLERYLNRYHFRKRKVVSSINNFMRNKSHVVNYNGKYYTEKEALNRKFNKYY